MYIGTIDPNTIDTYIIDDNDKIIKKHISFGENLFVLEYIEDNQTKFLPINY